MPTAKVRIGEQPTAEERLTEITHPPKPPAVHTEEQFTYTLPSGETMIVGKPRGVLKLKLRDILTDSQFRDGEIKEIGKAFLSVRSVDGVPVFMRTPEHFEAFLNRFGSDEAVDEFMNEWQKFTNPVVHGIIEAALKEAVDKGLMGDEIEEYVKSAVMSEAAKQVEKVK